MAGVKVKLLIDNFADHAVGDVIEMDASDAEFWLGVKAVQKVRERASKAPKEE